MVLIYSHLTLLSSKKWICIFPKKFYYSVFLILRPKLTSVLVLDWQSANTWQIVSPQKQDADTQHLSLFKTLLRSSVKDGFGKVSPKAKTNKQKKKRWKMIFQYEHWKWLWFWFPSKCFDAIQISTKGFRSFSDTLNHFQCGFNLIWYHWYLKKSFWKHYCKEAASQNK